MELLVADLAAVGGVGRDHDRRSAASGQQPRLIEPVADPADDVVLCGDLNIAPEDRDFWDVDAIHGSTHITDDERARFQALVDWGLVDAFRHCHPDDDRLYTWWDYRAGNFHKHKGMRIDHVLTSSTLTRRLRWSIVDRNARKGEGPSDHAPLIVDFADPER